MKLTMDQTDTLVDAALYQIARDVQNGDLTAIDELLRAVSYEFLIGFLSEATQTEFKQYCEENNVA